MKDLKKTKIRLLKSLNHPKIFSLYKISLKDYLEWKDESINFKYHPEIKKQDIISISKYVPGGLNFEPWIKIEFQKDDKVKDIYVTSRGLFGFGSFFKDNTQIEHELKMKYLNKK